MRRQMDRTTRLEQFFLAARELQNLVDPQLSCYDEKRKSKRHLRSLSISIQPLDKDFQPDGEKFWVVSRDISLKGIGLISYDPIEHDFVRIGLMNETLTVIGQVRHNTSIGQQYPLFLVGVEFLEEGEID